MHFQFKFNKQNSSSPNISVYCTFIDTFLSFMFSNLRLEKIKKQTLSLCFEIIFQSPTYILCIIIVYRICNSIPYSITIKNYEKFLFLNN